MMEAEILGGAVGLLVVGAATVLLWLDRRGRTALVRTSSMAVAAVAVTVALGRGGVRGMMALAGEAETTSAVVAAVWLAGLAAALGLAGFLGWTDAPLEGVTLGAVAGAAAGVALGHAVGESASLVLASLRVGWQTATGACVGGWASLAGLQRSRVGRVGIGAGALLVGWVLCGALLLGQLQAGTYIVQHPLLAAAIGVLAAVAVTGVAVLGHHVEARILMRELAEEARFGIIPAPMAEAVARIGSRLRAEWWPRADERRWLAGTLTELALRKHRLCRKSSGAADLDGLHIGRIRARVRACFGAGGGRSDEDG